MVVRTRSSRLNRPLNVFLFPSFTEKVPVPLELELPARFTVTTGISLLAQHSLTDITRKQSITVSRILTKHFHPRLKSKPLSKKQKKKKKKTGNKEEKMPASTGALLRPEWHNSSVKAERMQNRVHASFSGLSAGVSRYIIPERR